MSLNQQIVVEQANFELRQQEHLHFILMMGFDYIKELVLKLAKWSVVLWPYFVRWSLLVAIWMGSKLVE
jgi:hypothetical protein